MALSTRAKIAGLTGALALGVLGATGYAYAAEGTTASYVTTVDEGSATSPYGAPAGEATSGQAPAPGERSGDRGDCPEGSGGGSGQRGEQAPAPESSQSAPESESANPADA